MSTNYRTTTVGTYDSDGEVTFKRIRNRKTQKRCNEALNSRPHKVTFEAYDFNGNTFEVDGMRWNSNRKTYCHTNDAKLEFGNILFEAIQAFALYYGLETQHRCHMALLGEERPVKNCLLVNWDYLFEEMRSMGIHPIEIDPKDTVVRISTSN